MDETPKSDILKNEVLDTFNTFMDDLLIICESEIEKQLLLSFVKYIFKDIYSPNPFLAAARNTPDQFTNWQIISVKRIWDSVEWIFMEPFKFEEYTSKGYRPYGPDLVKTIGVEFKDENDFDNSFTKYKLIPQFEVKVNNSYRLDFALLAFHYENNKLVKESKVAIECDGFEYHSTKNQLTQDNQKHRTLQLNNWKTYRMSGSEIFGINSNKKIESIINDMRKFTK